MSVQLFGYLNGNGGKVELEIRIVKLTSTYLNVQMLKRTRSREWSLRLTHILPVWTSAVRIRW